MIYFSTVGFLEWQRCIKKLVHVKIVQIPMQRNTSCRILLMGPPYMLYGVFRKQAHKYERRAIANL